MSSTSSKNKEKRSRSASESNRSFVKNVTSRVSGLLPATITKWFNSPSSSNTNGSAQVADATDSSTEDESPESPVSTQPPAKRMRYTSPGNYNQFAEVETRCASTNTETINESHINNSLPMERNNLRKEKTNQSSNETANVSIQDDFFMSQHSLSSLGHSTTPKRKSLFDNSNNVSYRRPTPTHVGSIKDPYFKLSLLSSPFYVGRTMYGGAASSYMSQPNIKERDINLTNETVSNASVNVSHSTRRVMDLLEHYSSPLAEAKRIPQAQSPTDRTIINSPQKSANQDRLKAYKYQELHVPSIANILTIKRKSRLMDTTKIARQIIASYSSSSEILPYPNINLACDSQKEGSGDKFTTKIKTRITKRNCESNIISDNDFTDNVCLPNVVLQIDKDNLPKFTFGPSQPSQTSSNSSIQTPVIITPDALKRTTENNQLTSKENVACIKNTTTKFCENKDFKFSSEVTILCDTAKNVSSPSKFLFGGPEKNVEKILDIENEDDHSSANSNCVTITEKKLSPPQKNNWKCLDCWVLNKTDVDNCVCCGGKKPVELENDIKKCSVCKVSNCQPLSEKCAECIVKCNNKDIDNAFVTKSKNSSKWKCNDCWVDNEESIDKCVCCGGKNPNKMSVTTISSENNTGDEWKCDNCWIKNKNTLDKCAACDALKPGLKCHSKALPNVKEKTTIKNQGSLDKTFKKIAQLQCEKWECPICLVRNESNRETCSCCEADKPGTVKECHKRIFNFHQPSEITFKFGIQPKTQEINKKQDNVETEESNMGEEQTKSETNNNILPKAPTFSFSSVVPLKKVEEQAKIPTTETPKVNFTFGVSKKEPSPPVLVNTNTIVEVKNIEQKEKEKVQEVPQMFTPPQSSGFLKVSTSLFKTPESSKNEHERVDPVPTEPSITKEQSKELTFFNPSVTLISNSDAKTQQSNFTFSSVRPATNLFASTTTVATSVTAPVTLSTTAASTIPIFQKPDATTTSSVSFFQSTNTETTTAGSLFPKPDATTTTPSVSVDATAPLFSFGSLGQLPQTDKPKFQFNFGTNKSETPSPFKPTFGISNENNVSTSKFNISSNSITSGNGLTVTPPNNTPQANTQIPLTTENSLANQSTPGLFGNSLQKDWTGWPANNNVLFPTNTATNTAQKPSTFTFATSTPFNSNSAAFGNTSQQAQNAFGISASASPLVFGNQLNNQTTPNIFGSPQPPSNTMPMGMFGTSTFGTPSPAVPSFETSVTPASAPTFNFGGQTQPNIFGFGQSQPNPAQQQAEGQPTQPGMYNFVPTGGPPQQLQFNMGSAPNTGNTGRRVIRKAMRRTQR